ncbi:MAG: hypothetical protein QXP36_08005 [Conexivisphaerales archaeon]
MQIRFNDLKLDIEGSEPSAILGGGRETIKHVSQLIYEVDRRQLELIINSFGNSLINNYERLKEELVKNGFTIDSYEPDRERYKLLLNNVKAGNIKIGQIVRNETMHAFWYTRKTISDFFSGLVSNTDKGLAPIEMVYAFRDASQ